MMRMMKASEQTAAETLRDGAAPESVNGKRVCLHAALGPELDRSTSSFLSLTVFTGLSNM